MSASNWTTCPRCVDDAQRAAEAERERVMGLYGRVPVEEFDRERAALKEPNETDDFTTFREDYEFYGAKDGTVSYYYRGSCTRCGLSVDFKGEKQFWPEAA